VKLLDKSIKRTEQEIDAVIQAGQQFVKEWPRSMFGDDNIGPFRTFKKLCEMAKQGYSADYLRRWIEKEFEDEEDEERLHLENEANDIVDWLSGKHNEKPY